MKLEPGDRYYAICDKETDVYLEDSDWNVLRFETEQDAIDHLLKLGEDVNDYEIVCLRW